MCNLNYSLVACIRVQGLRSDVVSAAFHVGRHFELWYSSAVERHTLELLCGVIARNFLITEEDF